MRYSKEVELVERLVRLGLYGPDFARVVNPILSQTAILLNAAKRDILPEMIERFNAALDTYEHITSKETEKKYGYRKRNHELALKVLEAYHLYDRIDSLQPVDKKLVKELAQNNGNKDCRAKTIEQVFTTRKATHIKGVHVIKKTLEEYEARHNS